MVPRGSSIISKSTMRRCTERKAFRSRSSAFAHAFVERASLARPTLSIERRLRRTGCPRIRVSGVMECRVLERGRVGIAPAHRVGHIEKSGEKISYGH